MAKGAVWGEDISFRTVPAVRYLFYGHGSTQNFFLSRMGGSGEKYFFHPWEVLQGETRVNFFPEVNFLKSLLFTTF